jgi:U3 small nucleolar RNA-associated protein 14
LQILDAALPRNIQQKQERKAAYIDTSRAASKWTHLIQAHRQARTLRLTRDNDITRVATAAGLAAKHVPATDFEGEIAALLKEAGHDDIKGIAKVREPLSRRMVAFILGIVALVAGSACLDCTK